MADKKKISEDVALVDITKFLKKFKAKEFRRGQLDDAKIREEYIDVLEAIEDGLITFNEENHPTYTLRNPIEVESKDKDKGTYHVNFKTRVKPSEKARIMDGLNVEKQAGTFAIKYICFVAQLSKSDVDMLSADDYDVINQICSVF